MLSTASPNDGNASAFGSPAGGGYGGGQPGAASMLTPMSAAAYLEMASRALGGSLGLPPPPSQAQQQSQQQQQQQQQQQMQQNANDMSSYGSALAAAAFQERQQQFFNNPALFSAMCGAVLNGHHQAAAAAAAAANPLAAVLSNPAAAAALMAPHLMAACFREEPKPPHSYIGLIAMAILSSPEKKMVLSDIYQWILDHYPYFRTRGPGWRNSIRHNLSLNDCFVKVGRSANGKGHYWAIHPANLSDFQRGDFRRKKAQKRIKKHMGIIDNDEDDDDEIIEEQQQQLGGVTSDEDEAGSGGGGKPPKSSLSLSPAERFSEFLLMKNGGGANVLCGEDLDPVSMAARLAMRLSAANTAAAIVGSTNVSAVNYVNGPYATTSNSSQASTSPVEVVIDDCCDNISSSGGGGNKHHLHRLANAASCSPQGSLGDGDGIDVSASKKRRIFDIDSLLAPSS